jgi:hypothetical protein
MNIKRNAIKQRKKGKGSRPEPNGAEETNIPPGSRPGMALRAAKELAALLRAFIL